uniref:Uncharacterized protein n=1 Tax=Macrostomum lignano TaxID=282301 RepID=A0A1I8I2V1_9PLAT
MEASTVPKASTATQEEPEEPDWKALVAQAVLSVSDWPEMNEDLCITEPIASLAKPAKYQSTAEGACAEPAEKRQKTKKHKKSKKRRSNSAADSSAPKSAKKQSNETANCSSVEQLQQMEEEYYRLLMPPPPVPPPKRCHARRGGASNSRAASTATAYSSISRASSAATYAPAGSAAAASRYFISTTGASSHNSIDNRDENARIAIETAKKYLPELLCEPMPPALASGRSEALTKRFRSIEQRIYNLRDTIVDTFSKKATRVVTLCKLAVETRKQNAAMNKQCAMLSMFGKQETVLEDVAHNRLSDIRQRLASIAESAITLVKVCKAIKKLKAQLVERIDIQAMLRSMCAADLGEAGDLTEAVGEK